MKIIYAGSPEYAVAPLKALVSMGYNVVAALTQPDKPAGRKKVLTPTPVKEYARSLGIPVYDFSRVRDHAAELKGLGADVMFTCAYGQILSEEILKTFPLGVYNLHASLLPEFRGASPIQSAILSGCEYTGVTVMKTEPELDSGAILLVKRVKIDGRTCGELSAELSKLSAEAVLEAAQILDGGEPQLMLQDEARATYCKKISKQDAAVDFTKPAAAVANLINAYSPSPAAYANLNGCAVNFLKAALKEGAGEIGEVLSADKNGIVIACAGGAVNITRLQFAGGKPLTASEAVNGRKIKAGDRFD
ncbi:MAG: methionyl-tRNA formyltransferase [Roseburia sp.]|nr:methionyl-tRNA formyltransferase [Roseburia sp.]